jgi:hypothetical protein
VFLFHALLGLILDSAKWQFLFCVSHHVISHILLDFNFVSCTFYVPCIISFDFTFLSCDFMDLELTQLLYVWIEFHHSICLMYSLFETLAETILDFVCSYE